MEHLILSKKNGNIQGYVIGQNGRFSSLGSIIFIDNESILFC